MIFYLVRAVDGVSDASLWHDVAGEATPHFELVFLHALELVKPAIRHTVGAAEILQNLIRSRNGENATGDVKDETAGPFDWVVIHERQDKRERESCKRFFAFSDFLFPKVGHHFLASREAEILHVGHAGDVVVTVFNRLAVDRDDALHASILEVKVEVAFL